MANIMLFLRTQGTLILMGMLLVGAVVTQIQAWRRYQRLKKEIAALRPHTNEKYGANTDLSETYAVNQTESRRNLRGVRYKQQYEEETNPRSRQEENTKRSIERSLDREPAEVREESEIDSGLQQLKQSLDRIAVSREQKTDDTLRKGRVLTAAEQKVIADILSEYLA